MPGGGGQCLGTEPRPETRTYDLQSPTRVGTAAPPWFTHTASSAALGDPSREVTPSPQPHRPLARGDVSLSTPGEGLRVGDGQLCELRPLSVGTSGVAARGSGAQTGLPATLVGGAQPVWCLQRNRGDPHPHTGAHSKGLTYASPYKHRMNTRGSGCRWENTESQRVPPYPLEPTKGTGQVWVRWGP